MVAVNNFTLWTSSSKEARENLVKSHKKDFDGKFVLMRKSATSPCKKQTIKEKKLHALGHLWYLETHKLFCVKKGNNPKK